ncbi:Proteasome inhibitor PI31 subunit [Hypsizygus marmoreus]|uniref:Proteasome inhibitor PI31 subunit n=1 Tax=Hypsizygus marmoreus TaxID=39966 RepID=A0A369JQG9_HYPMA|nr:Proteasome inhibitor PI31 subunit [Hypsizygus marmoreus]
MTNDILDPSALISLLPTLLPPSSKHLASPQDAIAALLHSIMSAVAFRLVAVDETSPSGSVLANVLPAEWNKNGPGNYTFRYRHDQSSLEFVLKVSKLGGRTLINAIAVESDKVASLDLSTNDFVSPSFFPHDLGAEGNGHPLVYGFVSSNRVADLTSQIKLKILQKLIPGLRKEGYTEVTDTSTNAGGSNPPAALYPPPARPQPEGPPYAPERESRLPYYVPPENPLEIGRRDLDPFPINPFAPPPLFPNSSGGMLVGPDHPIFGAGRGRADRGPWGGDGYLPPLGAPPGARFDPVGPGPLPPLPGSGGIGGQGMPPRRGPPSGEPDNDEFMPPGMRNMFM